MKIVRLIALALVAFAAMASAAPRAGSQIDFGASDNVIDLTPALVSYHAPSGKQAGTEADGSVWYMLTVTNSSVRPASRVLIAGQPPRASLHFLPRGMRPAILAVASSDAGTTVETANTYGRKAWRVTVPPVTSVGLALRVGAAETPPALQAWTEPALAGHNRQLAIFITAVGTLIGAAALITGGLAFLIGHAAPRWVALTLFILLLSWLSGTGMFDASLATRIGGPYGLSAFLISLALAAGTRLADAIIPIRDIWPAREKLFHRSVWGLMVLGLLAYIGLPGATLVTDIVIVSGSLAVAVYLAWCGRRGVKAAQVVAPSAAAFALVAVAAAVTALGGLGENLTGPAATGGFAAAGAILLALAVIASEEIAVLPFLHGSNAARLLEARAAGGEEENAPIANLALAAIGASHQGVFDLDFRSEILTLSPEGTQMAGFGARASIAHADWIAQIHPEDREVYVGALEEYRDRPGFAFRLEFRCRAANGGYRWLELRATIVTEQNVPSDCLGLLSDIDQRKQAEIATSLPHDPLTGLGNRVALMEELDALDKQFAGAVFALLDIDRFKAIHASLGDAGADQVLQQMARRLESLAAAEGGRLFRVGGDAFALLFAAPRRAPSAYGDALLEAAIQPFRLDGREVFAPASIGLATGAQSGEPLGLIANAELAMNAAKRLGGSSARVYSPDLQNTAPPDSVALESALRHALAAGHLDIWYQPIMRLADRSVAGFEALLRWHHPEKGIIEPADFIAHSEETGLIVQLGQFALERAAGDLAHWQRYFPLRPPLFVSVNLSRRQLRDFRFESSFRKILAGSDIAPGTLNLEITESAVMSDENIPEMLERLRAAGAGLSIDDFGTGTSSLSQFRHLPFDTVKIDRSFLARHGGTDIDADGEVVLTSIIGLAHDLKRSVVVEGVESEADAEWLTRLGCEYGQGFFFAVAMPAAEALEYVARHYDIDTAAGGAKESHTERG